MRAIVISGKPASGKTSLATLLSGRLGVPALAGSDMLREMAAGRGYNPVGEDWWDTGEGARFLGERSSNPDFDREADRRLCAVIEKGDVIATSLTAPWLTKSGFRIWLSASAETRARRMAARDHIEVARAVEVVAARDAENYALYRRLYGIDFGNDLKPFDAVIETDGKDAAGVEREATVTLKERGVIE